MIEYLLGADLLILTICQMVLVWHCSEWRKERPKILESMSLKATDLTEILTEYGHLLSDIGDLLDSGSPAEMKAPAAINPLEIMLGLLNSRTPSPPSHGTSETGQDGEIQQSELIPPQEQVQERI